MPTTTTTTVLCIFSVFSTFYFESTECFQRSTLIVPPLIARTTHRRPTRLAGQSDKNQETLFGAGFDSLIKPVPLVPNSLATVFVPLLILPFLVVPAPQAILASLGFVGLRTVALQLVLFPTTLNEDVYGLPEEVDSDEDEEERIEILKIDATCYGLSVLTAGILAPSDFSSLAPLVLAIGGLGVFVLSVPLKDIETEEQLSRDEKLMNRWEQKLEKDDE